MSNEHNHDAENERDLINLLDEEGNEHEFEIIDACEVDDRQYMAMIPVFEEPADSLDDSGELVILRVSEDTDEGGEQFLEAIENEEEYDKVAKIFMERLEDEFDFEEEEVEEVDG